MDTGDPRNRPIILQTGPFTGSQGFRRPRPRTLLGSVAIGSLTAGVLLAASWSVWSIVGSAAPTGEPVVPLWFSPPAPETSTDTTPSIVDQPRGADTAPTTSSTRSGPDDDGHRRGGHGHRGRG